MARQPKPPIEAMAPNLPTTSPQEFHDEQQLIAARAAELQTIDLNFALDHEPYDYTRVLSYARASVLMQAQAILVLGRACLLLREHEPPERFHAALEQIGLSQASARNYMAATLRFGGDSKKLLVARLSASKLIELTHESDEAIDALLDGGTVANKTLDEIERMSVRELKAALREARADADTHKDQLLAKDEKINELDAALHKRPKRADEQARAEELIAEYDESANTIFRALTAMEQATTELYEVRRKAGHVFTVAINEKLIGTVSLLAKRLSKLQQFEAAK